MGRDKLIKDDPATNEETEEAPFQPWGALPSADTFIVAGYLEKKVECLQTRMQMLHCFCLLKFGSHTFYFIVAGKRFPAHSIVYLF